MEPKEMAKWLGELAAFLEDQSSIPSTQPSLTLVPEDP